MNLKPCRNQESGIKRINLKKREGGERSKM